MEPVTFESQDVGEVEAFVSELYSRTHLGAGGERTPTRITRRVMDPRVAFDDLEYSFTFGYAAQAQEHLVLCDVVGGAVTRVGEGHDETFLPGDQFLICRPDLPYAGTVRSGRLRQLTLDPTALAEVASSTVDGAPVRVLDHRPVSVEAAVALRSAVEHVRATVLDAPHSSLVTSAARRYLAAMVLEAYPSTAVLTPSGREHRDAHPGTLRRALAHMEANAGADLTLADVAAAAFVTPRALQLAFRRHLGTTPMAHLRRVRLRCADADLRDPVEGTTVAAIARRWGFAHLGRFAATYREVYGRSPSQTLHG